MLFGNEVNEEDLDGFSSANEEDWEDGEIEQDDLAADLKSLESMDWLME